MALGGRRTWTGGLAVALLTAAVTGASHLSGVCGEPFTRP
jgi:hypothetical protein